MIPKGPILANVLKFRTEFENVPSQQPQSRFSSLNENVSNLQVVRSNLSKATNFVHLLDHKKNTCKQT